MTPMAAAVRGASIQRMNTPSPSQSSLDVMHRYVAAMRSGDRRTAYAFFAEDMVFHIPGRSRFAGTRRGREGAIDYIESAVALAHHGEVEVELVDVLAGSDRIDAVVDGLRGLGASIEGTPDGFVVQGTGGLRGGVIESHGDHRLAMLGAVAGLASEEGVRVIGMDASNVSYPQFLEHLGTLA